MGSIFMLIVVCILSSCLVQLTANNYNFDDEMNSILFGAAPNRRAAKKAPPTYSLDNSLFQMLENYQLAANPTSETKYPWIAKVIHSTTTEFPFLCTASCIEVRIFITSARCLASAKISLTTVLYKKTRFSAKVFVLPSHPTKQWFDDVGIIVVENNKLFQGSWSTVQIFSGVRKINPNNEFQWFEELKLDKKPKEHSVIAYAADKFFHMVKTPQTKFKLVELDVVIGINLCEKFYREPKAFHVPCYQYCTLEDLKKKEFITACKNTICADGGAVYNTNTQKLLGVATWGYQNFGFDLPVGFSVPNSDDFKKDLTCARKIRDDNKVNPPDGYHQNLCPK